MIYYLLKINAKYFSIIEFFCIFRKSNIMVGKVKMPYKFTVKSFEYNGIEYTVAISPELYPDEDGLDFTGNYIGILISSKKGTSNFELFPDAHTRWASEPKGIDPGIIDELDKIINEIRNL